MKRLSPIVALLMLALAGCVGLPEVREGKNLIAEGRTDEGLAKLEQTSRDHPGDGEARAQFLAARERILAGIVTRADATRAFGELAEAEALYRRALRLDPANVAAQNGLVLIARDRRHIDRLAEAEKLVKAGNVLAAEPRVREVLAENPQNRTARALMRQIAEAQAKGDLGTPTLNAALTKPITLEFRDANLRSVFEVISRTSGINFVFDRDVRADLRTTIFVRNANLEDVIRLLLVTNQLDRKVMNENSLLIFPNTPAKQKDYQELVVRSFYLANADVKQTAAMVRALVKTRDIFIDERLNLLVIKDTRDAVRLAEKLVATQDLGEPEVMLEVEVLEVATSKLQQLGLRFPDAVSFGVLPGSTDPSTGAAVGANVRLNLNAYTWFITNPALIVNLRQTDGLTNLLANPRIRVRNREKAKIHIGEKVPVITTTSTANVGVSSSVSYLDTGLKLDVEPNVYLDDEVAIKVQLEVSNILETLNISGTVSYRLGTRNTATTLRLRDGETQVLAGLINDEDRRTANRVPGISEFPLLGRLFSSNLDQRNKTEIVLLITPRVVRNLARPDTVAAEFASGTDAMPGVGSLTIRPTANQSVAIAPGVAGAAPTPPAVGVPPQPFVPPQPSAGETVALMWVAPSQAAVGQEFSVSLALPPSALARTAWAELVYDPKMLQPVGGPPGTGRLAVEVQGAGVAGGTSAPTEVRFRVVATAPGATTIGIENAAGVDLAGAPIIVASPGMQSLSIVAQGTK